MAVVASIFNSHAFHLTELKEISAVLLVIARLIAVMASECSQKIIVLGQKEFLATICVLSCLLTSVFL